jgi:hypothetical protein
MLQTRDVRSFNSSIFHFEGLGYRSSLDIKSTSEFPGGDCEMTRDFQGGLPSTSGKPLYKRKSLGSAG